MALKRKMQVSESFSMASMTDVIFLLLIFFLVTSTIIVPNVIKVSLPEAARAASPEAESARVVVDTLGRYYVALGKGAERPCPADSLGVYLGVYSAEHPGGYVAIHADERVPYASVVRGINAAAEARLKVVLATRLKPAPSAP